MNIINMTDTEFIKYAKSNYYNPHCQGIEDFLDDLNRIGYIKRLLCRYCKTSNIKIQLLLNHIVVLCNVFSIEVVKKILLVRINPKYYGKVKACLVFLNSYSNINDGIDMDVEFYEKIRKECQK